MNQLKSTKTLPSFSTQEELEALLLEGLDSGAPSDVTPEFWSDLHAKLATRRLENRKAS